MAQNTNASRRMSTVEQVDRLIEIQEIAGFYPSSFREMFEAERLITADAEGGVPARIREVIRHQQHVQERKLQDPATIAEADVMNPNNAAISLVREYITLYRSAGAIGASLKKLKGSVDQIDNPRLGLREVIKGHQSAVRAVVRFSDTLDFVRGESELDISPLEMPYFNWRDPGVTNHAEEVAGRLTIVKARRLAVSALRDTEMRESFWRAQIVGAKGHRITTSLAQRALSA